MNLKGWINIELSKLFEFKNGLNAGKESYGNGIKFINVMEVIYNNHITADKIKGSVQLQNGQLEAYLVKKGDVLFNRTSETQEEICLASVYLDETPVVFGGFVIRARPLNDWLDDNFKKYCFLSNDFREQVIERGQGGVRTNIGQADLEKVELLIPPLSEQKYIAQILSVWDKSIETLTQLIAAKQQLKKGLMQQLLTGEKRLPGFEEKWDEVCLTDIAQFRNGKGHENDIVNEGKFIVVNSKFISSDSKEFKTTNVCLEPLYVDEIVMVMSDVPKGKALAKCFIVEEDNKYTLNQRICAFRATKVNPYFLYYLLNRNPYFLEFDSGVGQTNLRKDDILECPLVLPSQKEQVAIVKILMSIDLELKVLKSEFVYYKLQKQGLMQQLLTGKKRVKV